MPPAPTTLASCIAGDVVLVGRLTRVRVAFHIQHETFVRAIREGGGFGDLASFPSDTPVTVEARMSERALLNHNTAAKSG